MHPPGPFRRGSNSPCDLGSIRTALDQPVALLSDTVHLEDQVQHHGHRNTGAEHWAPSGSRLFRTPTVPGGGVSWCFTRIVKASKNLQFDNVVASVPIGAFFADLCHFHRLLQPGELSLELRFLCAELIMKHVEMADDGSNSPATATKNGEFLNPQPFVCWSVARDVR